MLPAPEEDGKERKKHKRKSTTEDDNEDEDQGATEKRKKKKSKKSQDEPEAADSANAADATAESWNVNQLEGGNARQAKMLRLLGGKKSGVALGNSSKSHDGKLDSARAEADLQRQFEAGMAAKHEGGAKRRGLGA